LVGGGGGGIVTSIARNGITLVGIALWRYPVFFISLKRTAEDDEGFPTAGALVKSRP
jgi:hypothetical protein